MNYKVLVTVTLSNTSFQLSPRDLISVNFGTVTRDDKCELSFGVIEQNVSLEFCDRERLVAHILRSGLEVSGNIVIQEVDENDNVLDTYSYSINDVDLTDDHTIVKLKGIDATSILDNVIIPRSHVTTKTAHELLTIFFSSLPSFNWKYYDAYTEAKCRNLSTPRCWYREGTLREFLDKVCTLAFLKIFYKNSVFYVMGGVI